MVYSAYVGSVDCRPRILDVNRCYRVDHEIINFLAAHVFDLGRATSSTDLPIEDRKLPQSALLLWQKALLLFHNPIFWAQLMANLLSCPKIARKPANPYTALWFRQDLTAFPTDGYLLRNHECLNCRGRSSKPASRCPASSNVREIQSVEDF